MEVCEWSVVYTMGAHLHTRTHNGPGISMELEWNRTKTVLITLFFLVSAFECAQSTTNEHKSARNLCVCVVCCVPLYACVVCVCESCLYFAIFIFLMRAHASLLIWWCEELSHLCFCFQQEIVFSHSLFAIIVASDIIYTIYIYKSVCT